MGRLCCGHGVYVSTGDSSTGLLWEDYVVVMVSMCLLGALLLDYYGKTVLWSWCLCVYWGLYYWIIMGRLCCGHGVLCVYWGLYYWIIMGRLCCCHGAYVSTGGSTTGLLWEDCVVVMVSMCLLGAILLDYYGKTMLWSWCLCFYWGLYYWIIMGRLYCGNRVYVSTRGSTTGLLWEDYVVVMVSMCLLEALLLDYYGKTVLWSWCLCVYSGLCYWIIMGRLCCGHGFYVSTGGSTSGLLWEDCIVVMVSMCLLGARLLDYYGKTMLWSCCPCVYWGLYFWIIMGRLYCGHGVYISTGGSSTGLLWEDCIVVMVSMYLLGALLLDYYGKTVVVMVSMCLLGALLLDYYGKTVLWSRCLCVYWGLYYWIIMGKLCCGHGVYVSTGGSTTGLLWEDCVVVKVSMCLLGALLLDYSGKIMLWSWCLCVYWGLYYWIIMGRLCCGHGVYVSTGGSTTGLLWEDCVVVMVSMCLLGALLLDYYGKTMLWSWCLCFYWGLYYWIIMGRLCCGHVVHVSTGGSTSGLLWEDYIVVMVSICLLGTLLLDYYGKTVVVMVSMCLLGALLLDYYGKTVLWSWCLCFYWGLYYWIIMGRLCCGQDVYVSTGGSTTGLLWEDYVVVMLSMCLLGALLLDYYGKTILWSWCLYIYWGLFYWIVMGRLCCGHGVYVSTGGASTGLLWEDCCGHGVYVSTGGSTTGLLWENYVVVMVSMFLLGALLLDYYGKTVVVKVSMCLLGALLLDYYGKTMLWSCCPCVYWGLFYWIIMGRLLWSWCLCVYWGLYYWIIMGKLCCGHGVYVVVMVSMCLLGALLLDYYGKTVLWSWCLCVYWGLFYWIIVGRLCCGHVVYVSTGGSTTGLLWEDYVVVMVSMCLLGALLLDYYGKTMLWSWCLCVYWGLYYWIIMGRLCCGHGVYVSTGGSTTGLLWEDYVVVMVFMFLLGALLLDYYGKTVLWSWCLCVYWGLFYWIIMGRLCCGHGVYVSTGGSTTGLLWEDCVVVMVSMCLLGALLLDYYGKTMLWSWCICVYLGLYYWIIMGRLCCCHGAYVSTGGSTTGLLWEDCVVVMVSMCLLGALLLDYYGKTMLWSWCLCVYWGLYYWIIMGRLCCGHGVYVSTGGSTTGLLWEDYVVVMVYMCLLGALLLDYYGKTMLLSWCLCVYWGLYYWIIMGRLCCGHGV